MRTDSQRLFEAGLALATETWRQAAEEFDWSGINWFIAHQTSVKHIQAMAGVLGMDPSRFPMTVPTFGNMGPAAVPFTLAAQVPSLQPGDNVLLLGIGSGLNTSFAEMAWELHRPQAGRPRYRAGYLVDPRWASYRHPGCVDRARPSGRASTKVERTIAGSSTFERHTDALGGRLVVVSAGLLALAEREHVITEEFKQRRTRFSSLHNPIGRRLG